MLDRAASIAQQARDLCPLGIARLGEILRDPKSKDGAVIRATELLLERGYGKRRRFTRTIRDSFATCSR